MPEASPFRSWNGREPFEFVDGVHLHAIGGDQVLLCRVRYEPGKQVPRHAHAHTEQIMAVIVENPSVDGPFGAKAIGEMANNAQAPAICAAIHDAVGVWVTEMPATPERVLRALDAKREPRRDGKRVIFDEEISVASLADDQSKVKHYFELDG